MMNHTILNMRYIYVIQLVADYGLAFLLPASFFSLQENLTSTIKIMHGGEVAS